jgi:PAS domain S-box-containing protein
MDKLWLLIRSLLAVLDAKTRQIQDHFQQIKILTEAAVAIAHQTFAPYDLQQMDRRKDQWGKLAQAFNAMIEALRVREQELAAARDRLEATLDAVPGPVSWVNSEGIYLGVNSQLAQTFNLTPEMMIGKPIGSFSTSPQYKDFMCEFLQGEAQSHSQEILVQMPDRTSYYLIAAQKYQQGTATVLVGIDMTEHHEAQEALRIAEENYRSIFETALEGIFQSSPEGHYLKVNQAMARIYGYESSEEMLACVVDIGNQIYVNVSDRAEFQRRIAESDMVKEMEYQVYRKDGSIIWIQEDTRAIRNNQGDLLYFAGIVQDITERKQREADLRQQLEALQIVIDQNQREKEVAQIAKSDYFQALKTELSGTDLDDFWR